MNSVTYDRCVVIIPTYNEAENIQDVVGRLRAVEPGVDVLIVDDNSPDGTGRIADELASTDDQVHVLHRQGKEGLGVAYIAGFRWAMDRGYDIVVEMDADGSHQPEQLGRLLGAIGSADAVIGSRWVPGGSIANWPRSRELLSRGGNAYIRLVLGLGLRDVTAGFRAYRTDALRTIGLEDVESAGYCFQTDLSRRAVQAGLNVIEVPIDFVERERGESKMSGDIMSESLLRVTRWAIADRADQVRERAKGVRSRLRRSASGRADS
ncbi:polyprenol monophosphomannose synthase [Blastococcus sp. Marseille-P5729]|uniref:polyprenol monophosphomannose synthase n=1 Tax=Blastococcus sp. Marseille-P5729 TaxID=2086582 RepID=UPI001F40E48A|nr:polyprenol monophosphomannose synthase [Blastococcus sp. Marseille-P5729]